MENGERSQMVVESIWSKDSWPEKVRAMFHRFSREMTTTGEKITEILNDVKVRHLGSRWEIFAEDGRLFPQVLEYDFHLDRWLLHNGDTTKELLEYALKTKVTQIIKLMHMPSEVRAVVEAFWANAREAWTDDGDEDFIEGLLYIQYDSERKRWSISDNYERFFAAIYEYDVESGKWQKRISYSEEPTKEVRYESVLGSASITYTG